MFYLCVLSLSNQVELSHPNAELRLLEVFYHKIYKVLRSIFCLFVLFNSTCYFFNLCFLQIFAPNEKIENINDQYWTLRAEEVMLFLFS
jgi:ubiquitin carboxyl-terminal hydrolase 7